MNLWVRILFFVLITGCANFSKTSKTEAWEKFETSFFADLWNLYPKWAFGLGHKDFAGQLKIPTRAYLLEQKEFLATEGCQLYQGYHFSRPLPLDKLESFVQAL